MNDNTDFPQDEWLAEQFDLGPLPTEPFAGNVMQVISHNRKRRKVVLTLAAGAGALLAVPGLVALWNRGSNMASTMLVSEPSLATIPTAIFFGISASLIGLAAVAWLEIG